MQMYPNITKDCTQILGLFFFFETLEDKKDKEGMNYF